VTSLFRRLNEAISWPQTSAAQAPNDEKTHKFSAVLLARTAGIFVQQSEGR
jgi:hypothetical protein